jgi:hypothetical protein
VDDTMLFVPIHMDKTPGVFADGSCRACRIAVWNRLAGLCPMAGGTPVQPSGGLGSTNSPGHVGCHGALYPGFSRDLHGRNRVALELVFEEPARLVWTGDSHSLSVLANLWGLSPFGFSPRGQAAGPHTTAWNRKWSPFASLRELLPGRRMNRSNCVAPDFSGERVQTFGHRCSGIRRTFARTRTFHLTCQITTGYDTDVECREPMRFLTRLP